MSLHVVALSAGKPNHDGTAVVQTEDVYPACYVTCFNEFVSKTLGPDAVHETDIPGKVWIVDNTAYEVILADTESENGHVYCANCGDAVLCPIGPDGVEDWARFGCDPETGTCRAPGLADR